VLKAATCVPVPGKEAKDHGTRNLDIRRESARTILVVRRNSYGVRGSVIGGNRRTDLRCRPSRLCPSPHRRRLPGRSGLPTESATPKEPVNSYVQAVGLIAQTP